LLMWSDEATLDGQQRISVPKKLLEFAGIKNKVMIVGMVDRIELWDPEEFDKYLSEHDESYEDVAAQVMNVGYE
ncbi:MAG: division/cell wall cluster transcriptional repressor MraZ, partial [Candidatus Kapaibacterium sp.]